MLPPAPPPTILFPASPQLPGLVNWPVCLFLNATVLAIRNRIPEWPVPLAAVLTSLPTIFFFFHLVHHILPVFFFSLFPSSLLTAGPHMPSPRKPFQSSFFSVSLPPSPNYISVRTRSSLIALRIWIKHLKNHILAWAETIENQLCCIWNILHIHNMFKSSILSQFVKLSLTDFDYYQ